VLGTDRLTKTGHLIGTVEYMSPEQIRGEETDARSDIYSLGILLYEMLTGCVPFNSTSEYELMRCQIEVAPTPPRTHAPQIPLSVEQAIMRSLAKKREARYQSAGEFRAMLMRRNTGAATRPLDDPATRAGGYAAPATKPDRAMQMAPPSGEVVKATRLAGDQNFAPVASSAEVKATRLGQPNAGAAYSQSAPAYYAPPPVAHNAPGQASFLSKLNWKHYAGAGAAIVAVIVAIIAGTLALVGGGIKPVEVQPATTAIPSGAQNPPAQNEPAAVPAQNGQPLPAQPTATPGASGNTTPVAGATPPGASSGRPRAGTPKTGDATSVSGQPPPTQPPPQTQPAPKPERVAASAPEKKEADKKEAEKKPEEKKRGLFGKLKDAITGSDKKKDPKKP
jgi:serine/threonine-protein kinase